MTYFAAQPAWFTVACVIAALLLFLGFGPLGYPGRIARAYGMKVPESGLYSRRGFLRFIERIGRDGLPLYRQELGWDVLFAILLAPPMVAVLDAVWATSLEGGSWLRVLVFVPLLMATFDILEDALLLFVTSRLRFGNNKEHGEESLPPRSVHPSVGVENFAPNALMIAQLATAMKFLTFTLSVALVLVGAIDHVVEGGSTRGTVGRPSQPPRATASPSPSGSPIPERVDVSFTYEMADRLSQQSDGTLRYLPDTAIQDREFVVTLDACESSPAVAYDWTVTTPDRGMLTAYSPDCDTEVRVPEGTYPSN